MFYILKVSVQCHPKPARESNNSLTNYGERCLQPDQLSACMEETHTIHQNALYITLGVLRRQSGDTNIGH